MQPTEPSPSPYDGAPAHARGIESAPRPDLNRHGLAEVEPTVEQVVARALADDLAEVEVEAEQDTTDLRGNVLASGDDEVDRQAEQEVADRLDSGDVWAWALVRVVGRFDGFEADDYLGGCTYADADDFKAPGGYFDDMRDAVLDNLAEQVVASGRYGAPGSVSSGSHRLDDLADAYASALDDLREARTLPRATTAPHSPDEVREVGEVDRLLGEVEGSRAALGDDWADSEVAPEQVERLAEALDAWALPGFRFGAHDGDGADFGFWAC